MVIILRDELAELREDVLVPVGKLHRDIGNFRPDDETRLVAEGIEVVVVLIVGKAHGIGAQLADEGDILFVLPARDGVAHVFTVLMAGDAAQGIALAVEEEAAFGIDRKGAQPKTRRKGIEKFAFWREKVGFEGIEMGIVDALPEDGIGDRDVDRLRGGRLLPGDLLRAIEDAPGDLGVFAAHDIGHEFDAPRAAVLFGRDPDAAAHRREVEVGAVDDEKLDIAVNAAEEGEVRRLRVDAVGDGVRNADGELHGAAHAEEAGDVGIEAGIAALVTGDKFAAYEDFRRLRDAVKAEIDFLVLVEGEGGERAGVGAFAAEIVAAAVLTVDGVPGVREGDFFACLRRSLSGRLRFVGGGRRRIFEEYPIIVKRNDHGREWFSGEALRVVCGFLLLPSFGFNNPSVAAPKQASDAATPPLTQGRLKCGTPSVCFADTSLKEGGKGERSSLAQDAGGGAVHER